MNRNFNFRRKILKQTIYKLSCGKHSAFGKYIVIIGEISEEESSIKVNSEM